MTKDEALKLALEALNGVEKMQYGRVGWIEYDSSLVKDAITAIKEALAQSQGEEHMTIAWYDPTNHHVSTDKHDPLFTPLGQLWPLHKIPSPLTLEEVRALDLERDCCMEDIRKIELAHGIGEKDG